MICFWDWFERHFDWQWRQPENITEICHRLRIQPPIRL